jgi:cell division septum initiation protein DivIVA
MAKPLTPQQVRNVDLPRGRRGFDEEATRRFLAEAAETLDALTRERDELQKRVAELSEQAAQNPTDAETLGAVLVTAQRVADELVAKSTEEAAELRAGAERERDIVLAQAQAEADAMATDAAASIESLRREEGELRNSLATYRQEVVLFLRAALEQLEHVEAATPAPVKPAALDNALLTQLPSE